MIAGILVDTLTAIVDHAARQYWHLQIVNDHISRGILFVRAPYASFSEGRLTEACGPCWSAARCVTLGECYRLTATPKETPQ